MIMENTKNKLTHNQIFFAIIALLVWIGMIFASGIKPAGAASTNVQNVPLITAGQNANNIAVTQGAKLQESIQNATENAKNRLNIGVTNYTNNDPDNQSQQESIVMDQVTGSHGFINDSQTPDKLFKATDRLGNYIVTYLIFFSQKYSLVIFIIGLIMLGFGVFRQRGRWAGITVMVVAVVLAVGATNAVNLFNIFYNFGNSLF